MELILKKDVENLGFADDLVTVKNGFGRNFLIPQGHAVLATPSAKKMLAETLKQRAFKEKKVVDEAKKQAEKLNGLEIKITAKTGEGDKLFGSVTNADLADALEKEGVSIEKKYIIIAGGAVKRTGPYEATIRFHRDVVSNFPFEVVAEPKPATKSKPAAKPEVKADAKPEAETEAEEKTEEN
ncbi:50S ribosomal protein L9 [Aequorivita vladivostokensis]|jgi:large subunit ribosomal protein L9|uniref:Large ribosomal subunit protein bL9 n=1 Tax=Aequorivita vladivostokensis TaxID=171194 RepID=A0ABR5DL42_9FLAO|nr:50S ribosomal protein L9 [Aequorivita vladivostokensis]MAB58299.1 50S ribosomal protein L9 [Aequorivita sp.]KJJ39462.1 50S ribosomal protein L9 [Aequorivita vladivostokensis]MAO47951.1 50S ribosomal protein L9 [Aequorivita sp.]MBF31432.1 50S ribosomal protein L9 [Aequorivita sp.]HAV55850.1 50S ribosomal protein L9 [Aequorivita sp.]|tara:strand:- start:95083 stop:95631 length:549 start_codon:yes stop_codon:yes gene_type:complete